jgi:4-alpha-glucanotransferase
MLPHFRWPWIHAGREPDDQEVISRARRRISGKMPGRADLRVVGSQPEKRAESLRSPPESLESSPVTDQPDQPEIPVITKDDDTPRVGITLPTLPLDLDAPAPVPLIELAQACGVATEFWDWRGAHVPVPTRTIVSVLAALDVPIRTPADVLSALDDARLLPWRLLLPDVVVVREGEKAVVPVHIEQELADGLEVWIDLEDGSEPRPLTANDQPRISSLVDGENVTQVNYEVPGDLPLGWHAIRARYASSPRLAGDEQSRPYVVTPVKLELPPTVMQNRAWGFMTQLYSVRSAASWGLGDLADLKELAGWSAREHGAGFVLVNPLHAAEPIAPMEASPYLPTTRRFFNPIYLRLEDIRETGYLPATERAIVEWQAEAMQALDTDPGQLDRDAVWAAKSAALQSIFAHPRSRERQASFEAFCAREGEGLVDFAMWSVLAEQYGLPTDNWPVHVLDPRGEAVAQMHVELADRVQFHMWLQWCLDEQLAAVAAVAKDAGMPIGVVHDLAVGVHPDGADAWALRDVLARDVTAGAPPDAFNQQGQDWSQPPWRPDRLVELGYAPYRDMLRTVLRHAGALRIDHIMGLFRFWWVPAGNSPAMGTYVRYDHEALIGILALEAHRAGAFVVGEDLGTVEQWAREYLSERGLLGTSILWFEKDGEGRPLPPESWRELCLATVTTHDLPPTAGYLAGEHVELRERLGLLTRSLEEERAVDEADRASVLAQLTELGLLGDSPSERDKVEALHRFLTLTPARLIGVALADAVGDRRTMNQPGTSTEYPNWRLPLADGLGRPMLLEETMDSARVVSLADTVSSTLLPDPLVREPLVVAEPEAEPASAAEAVDPEAVDPALVDPAAEAVEGPAEPVDPVDE